MLPSLPVPDALARALAVRDLTDPAQGPHAMQRVLDAAVEALARAWGCEIVLHRASPIVPAADNYERLHDPTPAVGGSEPAAHVLRTRAAAMIPALLERVAAATPADVLLVCPGVTFPAPGADGTAAEPAHEVELWRIRRGASLGLRDVARMVGVVAGAVAPGLTLSAIPGAVSYADQGRQVDVRLRGQWVRVARCGVALPSILAKSGLPEDASALVMTLDLDRLLMIAKGIDDVRLLRSEDPDIARQMRDLSPLLPTSQGARSSPGTGAGTPASATRRAGAPAMPVLGTIDEVRACIDEVDGRIVKLLAERRAYALEAARFKRPSEEVRVPAREEQVVAHVRALAREAGIEADLVEGLYRHLMDEFVRLQRASRPQARSA
jgi:phenylalanyl-tRNA synthetase alpha chain